MRWLLRIALSMAVLWSVCDLGAADFKMSDGSVISGELVAPNDDGSVIRRASGGLTSRMSWDKFSQETLHELAKDPKLKEVVEAFIDVPESADPAAQAEIVVKQPPGKIARPAKRPGFFSALTTPAGGFILLIIFLANLYAAYEVSVFRNYPVAAVLGTSVILPVLGPVLFLFMPTRVNEDVEVEAQFEAPQEVANTGAQELAAAGLSGSGLSLSAGAKHGAAPAAQAVSYKRGDVEFSRTFFEKTFPLFFRLTRTDNDKDSTLSIRSGKGEVVATRISRISANEIGLMTQQGREVQLRFSDITEVHLKPKAG
ncbi:MAG: hypothetical protein JNK85_27240 [Verrucomicrobiales bacterium]|nr:hypothetical protein [Verrucomicrobiales bacterium]